MKIPRYYFGDISNTTSNWILITERIEFADHESAMDFGRPQPQKPPLAPCEIEGPYDKCIDWNLRGEASEYYYALLRAGAKMAGLYKAGKLGDQETLNRNFMIAESQPVSKELFRVQSGPSGDPPNQAKMKIEMAIRFFSDTGKVLFPKYIRNASFQKKLLDTLLTLNGYAAEVEYWKHENFDFVALAHVNMNVDNAYFWRTERGKLTVGVFDWGGLGSGSLGHKLWWWLYCNDYDVLTANIDGYLDCFISTYAEHGGPKLNKKELRSMFILTALQQLIQLCYAVPQIIKMCPQKEWATIEDRWDPRIGRNIDGKSTLRLYLHVINNVLRMLEEWKADKVLEDFIKEYYCKKLGTSRKDINALLATK
jgi:hypothetical protein